MTRFKIFMTSLMDLTHICECNEDIECVDYVSVGCIIVCCLYDMIQLLSYTSTENLPGTQLRTFEFAELSDMVVKKLRVC
jgi:hypothetical protein